MNPRSTNCEADALTTTPSRRLCSRSDLPVSRQGAALSPLTIWYYGLRALFLLAKAALAYLPIVLSVALRPLFPFQQAQYAQVFRLKPVPFCKFFAGLGSTNNSAMSPLLLSDSRSVLISLFFHLKLSGRNCLLSPPVLQSTSDIRDSDIRDFHL